MFEKELFNYIKDNFNVENFNIGFGFGEVDESTNAPFISMYVINADGTRAVLCHIDNYKDGEATIQFSVYAKSYKNACYIGRCLDAFLADIRYLPDYDIHLNNAENIRGFPSVNTGLSMEAVTRFFNYTNKE